MAVHLTQIYTRTGDDGTTGLSDFSRVSKTDPRLIAYADCDETNATIGMVLAIGRPQASIVTVLTRVQNELFDLGADLATPVVAERVPEPQHPPLRIGQEYIDRLEADCDEFNSGLRTLDSFILPGGTGAGALLHLARTVARRAERSAWAQIDRDPDANPGGDVKWVPGGDR